MYRSFIIFLFFFALNCSTGRFLPPKVEADDADAVIVFDSTFIDVERDGRYIARHHTLIKILTSRGKNNYGNLSFEYYQTYDTVVILTARTIDPDGRVYPIDIKKIKDVPLPAFERFYIPNVRVKMLTFTNLTEGGYIEYEYKFIMKNPPLENHFDDVVLFESTDPIWSKYYSVTLPRSMVLNYKYDKDLIKYERLDQGDKISYIWWVEKVPKLVPEPQMGPFYDIAQKLIVSTVPDWSVWSRWYFHLCRPKFEIDTNIIRQVKLLTDTLKTEDDKITALHYWVAQRIRYLETTLSGRKGGYEPAPVIEIYNRRYGVCRDKAALLVAMLRAIGVDAYIVLTNPAVKVDRAVPADQFNHATVAIKRSGGYIYLDPTVENSRDWLVAYESEKGVLVCDSTGQDLNYIAKVESKKNYGRVKNLVRVQGDGSITGEITIELGGIYDYLFRSWLKDQPPLNREMFMQRFIGAIAPDLRLTRIVFPDFSTLYSAMKFEIDYESEHYGIVASPYLIFKSPLAAGAVDLAEYFLSGARLPDRKYPLRFNSTFSFFVEEKIITPEGYVPESFPDPASFTGPGYHSRAKFAIWNDTINFEKEFVVDTMIIDLTDYPVFRAKLTELSKIKRGEVILKKVR
ncbi:MAG: DUF3857 and transglutaminase domain-containing protein [candidate division WOR-3 bacterium]